MVDLFRSANGFFFFFLGGGGGSYLAVINSVPVSMEILGVADVMTKK